MGRVKKQTAMYIPGGHSTLIVWIWYANLDVMTLIFGMIVTLFQTPQLTQFDTIDDPSPPAHFLVIQSNWSPCQRYLQFCDDTCKNSNNLSCVCFHSVWFAIHLQYDRVSINFCFHLTQGASPVIYVFVFDKLDISIWILFYWKIFLNTNLIHLYPFDLPFSVNEIELCPILIWLPSIPITNLAFISFY